MTFASERSTADIIILIITLLIALSILLVGVSIFILTVIHPEYNLQSIYSEFSQIVGLLVGSVLGYLAGRGRSGGSQEK